MCGWSSSPARSSHASSYRIIDGETPNSPSAASALEPTGEPEAMCSSTTRNSRRSRREVSGVSGASVIAKEAGNDVVDEQTPSPLEDDSTVAFHHDAVRDQQREGLRIDDVVHGGAFDAFREAQPEHQPLPLLRVGRQLLELGRAPGGPAAIASM